MLASDSGWSIFPVCDIPYLLFFQDSESQEMKSTPPPGVRLPEEVITTLEHAVSKMSFMHAKKIRPIGDSLKLYENE